MSTLPLSRYMRDLNSTRELFRCPDTRDQRLESDGSQPAADSRNAAVLRACRGAECATHVRAAWRSAAPDVRRRPGRACRSDVPARDPDRPLWSVSAPGGSGARTRHASSAHRRRRYEALVTLVPMPFVDMLGATLCDP